MLTIFTLTLSLAALWMGIRNRRQSSLITHALGLYCEAIESLHEDVDELQDAVFEDVKLTFIPDPNDQGAN